MQYSELKEDLSVFKGKWAVAELKVSYKPKKRTGIIIEESYDAYRVFKQMWDQDLINIQEQFACLFLNNKSEVIGYRLINTGKLTSCTVDFNLIITCSLLCRARAVIFGHNHPTGNCKPSSTDKTLTFEARNKLREFEITILDHIILGENEYYSMQEQKII